ncbi:class I SAM-dependent methyltransferase [Paenibacillus piri]|uniref:Class I SAM-dependent methyltransferase n=1 Tax=Paenibacillus piri TaxID=2547395 RepID=A0A4R5KU90_9BACL|nr:class I SAM-dependent methyltransferase [Paenibacillus piri]TDF99461.1 class I SAM-dependent methyltransferase [Paenibacillus piri]
MTKDLFDAHFWENVWKTDSTTFGNRMKKAGFDPAHAFDHKAKDFNEQAFSEEGIRRKERIIGWLENQGVAFEGASVLDVGAASGGFSIPFAERGANVTAVEPCVPLAELLQENAGKLESGSVRLVRETFEAIDLESAGWRNAFDLVFASMCPTVTDWQRVENLISCASRFCYISLSAGGHEHGLMDEIMPLITDRKSDHDHSEMAYLLQLLYLKGYSFASLITREMKTTELTVDAAIEEAMNGLRHRQLSADEHTRRIVTEYLHRTYPDNNVVFQQGGRFGKVLIQIRDRHMYSKQA